MLEGILNVFRGLLAPVIAGVVAYIAYQQHKTNRDKLRLDLYNKRYEVFRSLMILLARILQQGNIQYEQVKEFSRATKEVVFLFDEGIETYLETIRKTALDLWTAEETMKPLPVGKERSAKAAEVSELLNWFIKQHKVAVDKFGKYLKFEQKLEGKAMNWKRGFRRIAFVLAVFIAFSVACLSVLFILGEHSNAKYWLSKKRIDYFETCGLNFKGGQLKNFPYNLTDDFVDGYKTELKKKYSELSNRSALSSEELFEQMPAMRELLDSENGFLVNLSKGDLIGLCIAGGLFGGTLGFVIVCLTYKLLEWLVLGFRDDKAKDGQKQ